MPRSGAGVYTLPPIYEAEPNTTIRSEQHNVPLRDIADALTNSLPRDGQAGMTGNLPMGGNRITGLAAAVNASDVPRWDQTRNASNLNAGAVPNARISGAYNNFTNITASGNAQAFRHIATPGGPNDEPRFGFTGAGAGAGMHMLSSAASLRFHYGGVVRLSISDTDVTVTGGNRFAGDGSGLTDIPISGTVGTVPVNRGGTGATSASSARSNLGANDAGNLTTGILHNGRLAGDYSFGSLTLSSALHVNSSANIGVNLTVGNAILSPGTIDLRPGNTADNRTVIATNGNMTVNGSVTANGFSGPLPAGSLTGTIAAARLGTTNADRNWVLARTAAAAVGAVGTYGTFRCESGSRPVAVGATRSGNVLMYSNGNSEGYGSRPSGTWRCMGEIGESDNSATFLRIA